MPVAPAAGVRERNDDEMAGAGAYLLVAAGAYVGLVRLVGLDPANLGCAEAQRVLHEGALAPERPAERSAAALAPAAPRRALTVRLTVGGASGHGTDCYRPEPPCRLNPSPGPRPVVQVPQARPRRRPPYARGREFEAGTFRLAWTQGVRRTRWLVVKLGLGAFAAMAVAGLLSLIVTWWSSDLDLVNGQIFNPLSFSVRGIVPIGYGAFAFVLGLAAGLLSAGCFRRWRSRSPASPPPARS